MQAPSSNTPENPESSPLRGLEGKVIEIDGEEAPGEDNFWLPNGLPDRMSVEPGSPFYHPQLIKECGIRFNGVVQHRIIEYCVSGGWIRSHVNKVRKVRVSKKGRVLAFTKQGRVEAVRVPAAAPSGPASR